MSVAVPTWRPCRRELGKRRPRGLADGTYATDNAHTTVAGGKPRAFEAVEDAHPRRLTDYIRIPNEIQGAQRRV